jgi:hypothetical protein
MPKITIQGKVYPSVNAFAKAYGVEVGLVRNRLRYKWTPEQAVEIQPRPNPNGRTVTVDGITYASIKEAALAFNIPFPTLANRLGKGMTDRQAVGLDEVEKKPHQYDPEWQVTVKGRVFPTLAEACRFFEVPNITIRRRIDRGWTAEEAFDTSLRKVKHGYPGIVYIIKNKLRNNKSYVGVTMKTTSERWDEHVRDAFKEPSANKPGSLREAIVADGVSAFTIEIIAHAKNHVEMQNLEVKFIKELNTLAPNGYNGNVGGSGSMPNLNHAITVNGTKYPSIARAIRELNITIPYQTIVQRINQNWTPEQAFGFEPYVSDKPLSGGNRREITVAGITYSSLAEACRQITGAPSPTLVQDRLTRGWTPDEAFNLMPHDDQRGKRTHEHNLLNEKPTSRNQSGYRGVSLHKETGRWQASFSHQGKRIFIGLFDDKETANEALRKARQSYL